MEEGSNYHPIACESCRNKKSKCDRDLPICSQCASIGADCRYPPTNKRGLPSGYVALVEQRLLESEIVIFELLSTLYGDSPTITRKSLSHKECQVLSEFAKAQSKSKKVEEWKNFPLATEEQRQIWWQKKQDMVNMFGRNFNGQVNTPSQSEVFQDTSPVSTGSVLDSRSDVPLPPTQGHYNPTTNLNRWEAELENSLIHEPSVAMEESETTNGFLSTVGVQVAAAGSPKGQPSPGLRPSNDRWRKYF